MPREETPDQIRDSHINAMGPELGPIFHQLFHECAWLHMKWSEFRALYATSETRIALLNRAAGGFFRIVQIVMREGILLHLARLTDPPSSGGKPNLTLRRLPPLVEDASARLEVQQLVDEAVAACAFAKQWRNRHIAHRDLDLHLGTGADPLPVAEERSVDLAVTAVSASIEWFYANYLDSGLSFLLLSRPSDAESLLYTIREGLEAEAARRERLRSGRLQPGDIGPPRPL